MPLMLRMAKAVKAWKKHSIAKSKRSQEKTEAQPQEKGHST
nr:hypothetical protein [Candidatus Sigynarchaeota archaeon]